MNRSAPHTSAPSRALSRALLAGLLAASGAGAQAQTLCDQLADAWLIASDRTFLGEVSDGLNQDSLFNRYGPHGTKTGVASIWNESSLYGSPVSAASAFNKYASTPPVLVRDGSPLAYVTTNPSIQPRVSPDQLRSCK
jgi:hypothetical protein